jgi:hypothetical protein
MTVVWEVAPDIEATAQLIEIVCDGDNAAREILARQVVIV